MIGATPWAAPAAGGPVVGEVTVPGSKSLTARHLILAALTDGPTELQHPLVSRDSTLMLTALAELGVQTHRAEDDSAWRFTPPPYRDGRPSLRGNVSIDCGLAGTVMRFVPAVAAAAADGPVRFDGDEAARTRPMGPLLASLRGLGIQVEADAGDRLPFTVDGTALRSSPTWHSPGSTLVVEVDGSASSQFISALLLAAPAFGVDVTVRHIGHTLPSRPHIEMTVQVLREAGVEVAEHSAVSGTSGDDDSGTAWTIRAGALAAATIRVEPDLSSAAPFLAAAAITGGQITVGGWPATTTQAGDLFRPVLARFDTRSELTRDGLVVTGGGRDAIRGTEIDLHDAGELTPVVAALLALGDGPSRIRGVAHLRGHETDRLAALQAELSRIGCTVDQTDDGLTIIPGPLRPALWHTYADHRMAMAGAVVALAVPGVQIEDSATTAKTFPGFEHVWEHLVTGGPPAGAATATAG